MHSVYQDCGIIGRYYVRVLVDLHLTILLK
jgi:hypothetical protein